MRNEARIFGRVAQAVAQLLHDVRATVLNKSTVPIHVDHVCSAEAEKIKLLHLEHDQRPDGPMTKWGAARFEPLGGHRWGCAGRLGPRLGLGKEDQER